MIDINELERREMYGKNSRITYAERIEIVTELRALREVSKAAAEFRSTYAVNRDVGGLDMRLVATEIALIKALAAI